MAVVVVTAMLEKNKREHDRKNHYYERDTANDTPLDILLSFELCVIRSEVCAVRY
jgi:hypothetical protein